MKTKVYFGTYTRGKSEGIYQAELDENSGQLHNLQLMVKTNSPTYLGISKDLIYSVHKDGEQGGIAAHHKSGQLINTVLLDGAPLCHLFVDEKRSLVYGANYHKGQITVYRKKDNGALALTDLVQLEGSGPHPNQKSAHAHFVGLTPDQYLVTCDLGTDTVTSYDISAEGKLKPIATYHSLPGAGSRHLVFHPKEKLAYLLCELNAQVEVLIYNGCGHFERLQTISTLPENYQGDNATAAVRISSDGKFLYTSNRGHDSIASFKIRKDGQLEKLEIVPCGGHIPRDFNISPSQDYLIVAHQESDNASVFKRDKENGQLSLLSNDFYLPESICVFFD
ncbi:lactonase family protein [Streptococcus uberis]|uniref:lactonase family protein n=1 Tax=Streptococcus uberis TaxID=1349 RepID=UPI0006202B1B|nr:lactonase family protein [Streptococcus uberis]KKF42140.1 hypothetical protein AF63_05535 [Streptococcus uberis Ab71]KKF43160.1 hypothetical protein AF64_05570 [Streptococcus uberis C9359]KKF49292.1 hypothetical protein AF62_05640 [Streptococcus uberis C8329]KKF53186.1 hypothetical protein AF65_05640 [Streptococcus uberis C5388]KKF54202.1 hypothetical protein AF66_08185 [Streptococcus uberis B190]